MHTQFQTVSITSRVLVTMVQTSLLTHSHSSVRTARKPRTDISLTQLQTSSVIVLIVVMVELTNSPDRYGLSGVLLE